MNVSEITIPVPWGHIAAKPRESDAEVTQNEESEQADEAEGNVAQPSVANSNESNSLQASISDNPFLSKFNLQPKPANNKSNSPTTHKSMEQILLKQEILEKLKNVESRTWCDVCKKPYANSSSLNLHYTSSAHKKRVLAGESIQNDRGSANKSKITITDKVMKSKKNEKVKMQKKLKLDVGLIKGKKRLKNTPQPSEENTDFLRTYNMVKIQNPKLVASRAAKLNLVKQTILSIENEKNLKTTVKDKNEKRCDDCGTPLSSGRDFIMHRDKCEVRQKKLEEILSGLNLPKSLQITPQKDAGHSTPLAPDSVVTNLTKIFRSDEDVDVCAAETNNEEATQPKGSRPGEGTPNKSNKSPFRTLYNLYDGLNREHIDIILNASGKERILRSRAQENVKAGKSPKNFNKKFGIDNSKNEIIITTRIKGNVIERNTLIRPVRPELEEPSTSNDTAVDEGQINSRSMYETLKNSCQPIAEANPSIQDDQEHANTQPRRELISDCPQGLPRSANIRKLLKRNVLNPIRRKSTILHESKKFKLERRNLLIEKAKLKSAKKKVKLEKLTSFLNDIMESPNVKKNTILKKKKLVKDFKVSWQVEETDKRRERAERATARSRRTSDNISVEADREERTNPMQETPMRVMKASDIQPQELRCAKPGGLFMPYAIVHIIPTRAVVQTTVQTESPEDANTTTPVLTAESAPKPPRSLEQILLKQEILEELKKLESRKWCDVCKKPLANNSSLNLHYTSSGHKKRVESSLFGRQDDKLKTGSVKKTPLKKIEKRLLQPTTSSKSKEQEAKELEDEEIENMCIEEVEESYEVAKDETQVVEKVKRGRPRLTPSSSENTGDSSTKRTRRTSIVVLEQTLSRESEDNQEESNDSPPSESKNKTCTTCNVSFPSDAQLNKHLVSKMHKTAEVLIAEGKPKVCSVCQVSFSVNSQLKKHYGTPTHKMAAAQKLTQLEERGVIKTVLFT